MRERILFDFAYYQQKDSFHGGGEYGNVVFKELLSRNITDSGLFFYEHRYVDMKIVNTATKRGWNIHPIHDLRNVASIVKQFGYTTVYSAIPYDLMWSKVNLPDNVRFIGTFHGLREAETALYSRSEHKFFAGETGQQPDFLYTTEGESRDTAVQTYSKALLAFQNKKIIVVSEHSKYSMHYYYPRISLSDIIVLYSPPKNSNPVDDIIFEKAFLDCVGVADKNFGLMISAGIYLKNALRGMMAYDRIFDNDYAEIPENYKVVILGVKDKEVLLHRIKHTERFILLGYVEEKKLETLYKHAQLFLYPTLNEGFGYPPLEAMKYGTLCACSGNAAIPEICGDMVLTFNPFLIDEIIVRILQSFSAEIRNEKMRIMKEKLPKVQEKQREDLEKLIGILMGDKENG
ncbi:MAG: glycosyltransferase [Blautia sp.]|nr:glycosyltransferase [Blautia sp.]MCM1200769.1 glycosyltransferase [Bacteroides fragilis]